MGISRDPVTENKLDAKSGLWVPSLPNNPQPGAPNLDLLQAGSNRFGQGSADIVVIQRPHVCTTKFLLLDVGRFRCHRGRIIVGVKDSGRRIVEGSSDSG